MAEDTITGILTDSFPKLLKAGIEAARESLVPLLGEKADDELIRGIKEDLAAYDNILGVHDLNVHNYGVNRNVITFHAEVPAGLTFIQAHELVDTIENELGGKYSAEVTIHMDPVSEDDELSVRYKSHIKELLRSVDSEAAIHDFRLSEKDGRTRVSFDVEVPFGTKLEDREIKEYLEREIKKLDGNVQTVICVDKKVY